jgi:hypothetical protein
MQRTVGQYSCEVTKAIAFALHSLLDSGKLVAGFPVSLLIPKSGLVLPVSGLVVPMRRQDAWRLMYRRNRYLESAPEENLTARARDIISNTTGLTYDGKIDLLMPEAGGAYWLELFTHVLEEMAMRGVGFPPGMLKDAFVPKATFPVEPRAKKMLLELGPRLADHQYVAKLGKREHLERTFRLGLWRISPASSYAASDPSLSAAQRDTELEMSVYLPKSKIQVWDGKTLGFKGEGETLGNIRHTSRVSDYYVSCLTRQLDLRLFDDFKADSCLVIHYPREFARRAFAAAKRQLPSCFGVFRDVKYVDPYQPPKGELDLFCSKDFRYWYQKEVRFAWLLEDEAKNLDHLFLELGDISDICQFVEV